MKIKYNQKVVGSLDQRFKDDFWTDGKKDPRIRKHKKARKINLSSMFKKAIVLLLILGFVGLHTYEKPQTSTTTPAEAKNTTQDDVEPPSWALELYPDKEIKENDSTEENVDLFSKYFGDKADTMRAICKAESGLDTNAVGDTNTKYPSVGLCQIRLLPERQITMEQMKIPDENLKYARLLYDKYGFKPWTMYKNGEYIKYLSD